MTGLLRAGGASSLPGSGVAFGWQRHAACRGADPDLFFGADGETDEDRAVRVEQAFAVCNACPVWRPCREFSQDIRVKYGVWGARDVEKAGGNMCRNGLHLMTPANTQERGGGTKCCRACRQATDKRYRQRREADGEVAA